MPRFTLHLPARSRAPTEAALKGSSQAESEDISLALSTQIPEGLRADSRLQLLGELPHMLLIECPQKVAEEWLARMPGWVLKPEQKATLPDPRPKLRNRLR